MLSFEQCLKAHRPLLFLSAESDVEVLKYLEKQKKDECYVYSTTLTSTIPLGDLLKNRFCVSAKAKTTQQVLDDILKTEFRESNDRYRIFVFLESDNYIHDKQNIRKVKDILSRYQLDEDFTVNLLFVSQTVSVPMALERLGEVVFFDLPDGEELKRTSDTLTSRLELKGDAAPTDEVVNNLRGLTHFEVEQAYLQSWSLFKRVELNFIRDFKKNAIAKTDLLSLLETGLTFDNVGGSERLKQWIKKSYGGWTVEGKQYGLPLLKGLMMVGIPGTGKSLITKCIGSEWHLPVIQFDLSKIFSSRVGESEFNMRRVLNIIESVAPCIIAIDEMEKAFAGYHSSSFSDAGVTSRILALFLTWMQDCEKAIFTIATCNDITYLPPELVSRFDEIFFINLPQPFERREIFKIHLDKVKRAPDNFDLDKLVKESQDFSGREIEQSIKESLYDAFSKGQEMGTDHLLNVLRKKTSINVVYKEQLRNLYKWVGWDSEKNDGVRARFSSIPEDSDVARIQAEIDSLINDVEGGYT